MSIWGQKKGVRYNEVSVIRCSLSRSFLMRVWPGFNPFLQKLSALRRRPLYGMSAIERFNCSWFHENDTDKPLKDEDALFTHYLLFFTCYPLFVSFKKLFVAFYLLLVIFTCYSFLVTPYFILFTRYFLVVTRYYFLVTRYFLLVGH